ncbi:uncharacterized protein PITG_15213 [Phytophthora infestans T30-4]|uniref:Transmembrane protein, putative n=1 Tax=Phytophthora infestans (strain T30-4) TaxID=403677 RepID=D0NQ62_PHYIT|nr:uncharacterized protein PITG_15213 [Phytophthora infestans T30-4]EEY62794.1 transmembrane protein, putative [Phytophthora infestans T30-4]|eukprot:XP_002898669.1 transmembrane protein, putative [Phytophthora infestans T30-4]
MIFNVDVFNALYVSSSMQASQSIMTVVQMVALDALLAWIPAGHPLKNASFIEIAIQITDEDPQARDRLAHPLELIPTQKSLATIFTAKERQRFLQHSARVLFTTEFVILVEYTEVIVPFIYSTDVHSWDSFDDTGLASNLGNIVTFGFIELGSLLVIGYLIQRMLNISMLYLLVFVLDRSWRMVQSNLFLWICYTIQNSLEHNGTLTYSDG